MAALDIFNVVEVAWEFERYPNNWVRLIPELETKANQCVQEKVQGFTYVWPYYGDGSVKDAEDIETYEVDLASMTQKNMNNGTSRRIRVVALLVLKP